MRPIPDDVEPVPQFARDLGDSDAGFRVAFSDEAGVHAAPGASAHASGPECVDTRHRPLYVRKWAVDRWSVGRAVMDAMRYDKARLSPQLDASGHVVALLVDEIGTGCLAVLGFQTGDMIRTINGQELADWSSY